MAKQVNPYFRELPDWAKGVLLVAVLLLVAFLFYKGWRGVSGLVAELKGAANNRKVKTDLSDLAKGGILPSFNDSQYSVFASSLYTAMKGMGTDEEAVYSVFQNMNNDADVLKLITAFGTRDDESLAQWLTGDLDMLEMKKVNTILQNKGISFRF